MFRRNLVILAVLCLIFVSCKKPDPVLVPVGAIRIVGVIEKGIVKYSADENPLGDYNIVTPAFIMKFIDLAYEVKLLQLKLKECEAKIK